MEKKSSSSSSQPPAFSHADARDPRARCPGPTTAAALAGPCAGVPVLGVTGQGPHVPPQALSLPTRSPVCAPATLRGSGCDHRNPAGLCFARCCRDPSAAVVNLHWGFPPPQHAQQTQQTLADRATREDNGEDDSKDDDDDDDGVPPLEQGSSEATSGVLGNCSTVAFVVEQSTTRSLTATPRSCPSGTRRTPRPTCTTTPSTSRRTRCSSRSACRCSSRRALHSPTHLSLNFKT